MQVEWSQKRDDLQGSRWHVWEEYYAEALRDTLDWNTFSRGAAKENPHLKKTGWVFLPGVEYLMPEIVSSQEESAEPPAPLSIPESDETPATSDDIGGHFPSRRKLLEKRRYVGIDLGAEGSHAEQDAVKDLQEHLRALGYLRSGVDGIFGNGTESAIKALQYDLIHNEDDTDAPVQMIAYNKGRIKQITGIVDAGTAACIADLLAEEKYPLIPKSGDPTKANSEIPEAIAKISNLPVPLPFLLAILRQESNLKQFNENDKYLVLGLDHNDSQAPDRIASRGYGAGQYTLFYHPPQPRDIEKFVRNIDGNVQTTVDTLQDKFENFVNGNTSKTRSDDRIAEHGGQPLRLCKYNPDDKLYMKDCANCMRKAGAITIQSKETTWHKRTGRLFEPTQYHRQQTLTNVPVRANIECDWPYAVRRYNGSGVNSYWYQAKLLKRVAQSEIELLLPEPPTIPIHNDPTPDTQEILKKGSKGQEVVNLQLALSGFEGTVWDGDFGPGTERQVKAFQNDYMKQEDPTGEVDQETRDSLREFLAKFPIEDASLKCPCGKCSDFGNGKFKGKYRDNIKAEAYHLYEYPGIHLAILQAFRAAKFYTQRAIEQGDLIEGDEPFKITSGYRCTERNNQKNRTSTNHMGKALDGDRALPKEYDKRDDIAQSDILRDILVKKSGFQIGWTSRNVKALEPKNIAPNWIHMDVRCYEPKYLDDTFFVQTSDDIDKRFATLIG